MNSYGPSQVILSPAHYWFGLVTTDSNHPSTFELYFAYGEHDFEGEMDGEMLE